MSAPSPTAADIEQAKRNAAVAKSRVQTTVGALKQRLNPKNIAADAAQNVKEKTSAVGEAARNRPLAASAVAGAAALVLFRKPLGKLGKLLFRRKKRSTAEDIPPEPRKSEQIIRAGDPPKASVTPRIQRAVVEANAAALTKE